MLRHTSRWLALAGLVGLVLAACSSSPGSSSAPPPTDAAGGDPSSDLLARIQERGTLVGYAELDYPPQSIRVENATRPATTKCQPDQLTGAEVSGYDIETNKLVAADLGVEPCFARPTWAEVTGGNWGTAGISPTALVDQRRPHDATVDDAALLRDAEPVLRQS